MAETKDKNGGDKRNIHAAHRERMRRKFDEIGFKGWSKYEIVEYMLYYCIPRGDTNPQSHGLLDYSCGSVVNLLNDACDGDKLKCVEGIGEKTVLYLRCLKEFIDYYRAEELRYKPVRLTRDNFLDVINSIGMSKENENIFMICLDKWMRIKNIIDLTVGSGMYGASTETEKIVRFAATSNAANVVLVHNHPSGFAGISKQDVLMTNKIDSLLKTLNIFLVDHYIIADGRILSVRMST